MANEKSLVTLTAIVNSFSADVKEMISFNLENLKHYYENQPTSDIAKSYMNLSKNFIKELMRKILMMKQCSKSTRSDHFGPPLKFF